MILQIQIVHQKSSGSILSAVLQTLVKLPSQIGLIHGRHLTGIFRKNLLSRNLMVIINWFRMNVVTRKSNSRNLLRIQLETLKEYLQRKPLAGKTLTASQKMD